MADGTADLRALCGELELDGVGAIGTAPARPDEVERQ
jgi:hypothetical protein